MPPASPLTTSLPTEHCPSHPPPHLQPTDLTSSSAGGVRILNGNGKIDVNNTLEERLRLLQIDALPTVRNMLFGANEHRKFYD